MSKIFVHICIKQLMVEQTNLPEVTVHDPKLQHNNLM
jgi:hypothetical protein